ncbi:MAG: hypothetical protein K1V86_04755 [Duncaniella sp.]|jgi:intracellular septation protein A|uniref:DUF5715 family protein n=1 Tax=Duncaniella muricolitica TaxID=2880704 RepID=UPI0023CC6FD1|nr:DUF5715 family protein [Duncaniella muricolitica]MDE5927286.1 hypothetical protein [Duncaniella sp.]
MTPQQPTASPTRHKRKKRRRKINPLKVLRLLLPVILFIFLCVVMCVPSPGHDTSSESAEEIAAEQAPIVELFSGANVYDLEKLDTVSFYRRHLEKMPEPTQRIKVNYFGNLRPYFNDSNYVHWQEAESYGLQPLSDTRSHWQLNRPIVKVTTCADYFLDTLIFSRPYLVPEAAATLREIGHRFRDTIAARGGGDYRIKVTSVLRTPQTVRRLRRRNRNAIDSSVHQLGTTFDISYASFVASSPAPARSVDDLKGILAEVLKAMREENKIWVKYEVGQPCFHITARNPDSK